MPEVKVSHHHQPAGGWVTHSQTILRAGHLRASADYVVRRDHCAGQDLLFCIRGAGWVEQRRKLDAVGPGQFAWLANETPHAHGPDTNEPWELLWIRMDGPGLPAFRRDLRGEETPVFDHAMEPVKLWFAALFAILTEPRSGLDFALHHHLGKLWRRFAEVRGDSCHTSNALPEPVRRVIAAISRSPEHLWQTGELAAIAGVSPSQMRRLFQRATGLSPGGWVHRERLRMAETLLKETDDSIGKIADKCGFSDIYHFSRVFKASTGTAPSKWRASQRLATSHFD